MSLVKMGRILLLLWVVVGIPLSGFASASQAFCRLSKGEMSHVAPTLTDFDHSSHMAHPAHLAHENGGAMHPDTPPVLASVGTDSGDALDLADALHQCGQCAHCAAAHAMVSFAVAPFLWPQTHSVWVGAVPNLHGRNFTSAPERPPRALTV